MQRAKPPLTRAAMNWPQFLPPIARDGDEFSLFGFDGWMQGRTMYGGLAACFAYSAVRLRWPDLPPLRGAQIDFIGPIEGKVTATTKVLRAGRNVTQVASELHCNGQTAQLASWIFGATKDANAINQRDPKSVNRVEDQPDVDGGLTHKPAFLDQFQVRGDRVDEGDIGFRRWMRLRERGDFDPVAELLLLGDGLPPGSMKAMQRMGPISSINWSLSIMDAEPTTRDGWWLLESASQHADGGYSTERLSMWNADGQQVMTGLQTVAIFG